MRKAMVLLRIISLKVLNAHFRRGGCHPNKELPHRSFRQGHAHFGRLRNRFNWQVARRA